MHKNLTRRSRRTIAYFCADPKVLIKQKIRIVTRYLEQHPESLHKKAVWLVLFAMAEAFPCK